MNKKKKGFTIVELVVVIAVIGILSAILIPTFSGLIRKSQERGQQLELRNAYEAYAIEAGEDVLTEHQVVLSKAATKADMTAEAAEGKEFVWKLNADGVWVHAALTDVEGDYPLNDVVTGEEPNQTHAAAAFNGYYVYVMHVAA